MNPILRNILAVLAGFVVGITVNMGLVTISASVIPLPEELDMTTMEGVKEAMPLLQPKHFLMPFLAHALGTLAGAMVVAKLAASYKIKLAMIIGVLFLAGGITTVVQVGGPMWFIVVDLGLAYLPMAYFGSKMLSRKQT